MIFIYYAIKFIEAQGVKIQDPYHLKEALANKNMRFAEYIEIESGREKERPRLKEALNLCRKDGAILIVAKIFLHPKWIDTQLYLSLIIKN